MVSFYVCMYNVMHVMHFNCLDSLTAQTVFSYHWVGIKGSGQVNNVDWGCYLQGFVLEKLVLITH